MGYPLNLESIDTPRDDRPAIAGGMPDVDSVPRISVGVNSSGLGYTNVKIYVGNLAFETTESDVQELFSQHGEVDDVTLIVDRATGRPRGFGFVEMRNEQAARDAIGALDGAELGGRNIKVNEARPRQDRRGGGGQRKRW